MKKPRFSVYDFPKSSRTHFPMRATFFQPFFFKITKPTFPEIITKALTIALCSNISISVLYFCSIEAWPRRKCFTVRLGVTDNVHISKTTALSPVQSKSTWFLWWPATRLRAPPRTPITAVSITVCCYHKKTKNFVNLKSDENIAVMGKTFFLVISC